MKKAHIHSLDTLRGLAALAVCVFHSAPLFGFAALAPHAYLAVDFFFALSGLVLFTRYRPFIEASSKTSILPIKQRVESIANRAAATENSEKTRSSMGLWQFFVIRMARLYPLYLAATIGGLGYICLHLLVNHELISKAPNVLIALIQSLFLIPTMDSSAIQANNTIFPFVSQAWSVLWEVVASMAFFFWVRRGLKHSLIVSVLGYLALIFFAYPAQTIDGGWQGANIFIGFLRALASFSAGIAIAIAIETYRDRAVQKIGIPTLSMISYGAVALAAAYIIAPAKSVFVIEALMLIIIFPVIIMTSAISEPSLLIHPIGRWLGGISYALYLTHGVIAEFTITVLNKISYPIASPLFGIAWLAAMLGFSTLIWKFYEMPIQSWLRAKLLPPPRPI